MKNEKLILVGKLALAASTAFVSIAPMTNTFVYAEENITKVSPVSYTAKSQHGSQPIANSFDGDVNTFTDSNYNDPTGTGALPQIYNVTLDGMYNISKVRICPRQNSTNGRVNKYSISVSEDGSAYKDVISGTADPTSSAWIEIPFETTQGKYVRLTLESDFKQNVVTTAEVEIYGSKIVENQGIVDLSTKIQEAQQLLNKYEYDEYESRIEALKLAKEVAESVANKQGVSNEECVKAAKVLENAMVEFRKLDTSKLQEVVNEWSSFTSENSTYSYFEQQLNNAKALLSNAEATQMQIDYAVVNVPARAYCTKVAELNEKYDPDTFDYSKYDMNTTKDVLYMYNLTVNRTNGNYGEVLPGTGGSNPDNPGQMKGWYEQYLEAIEKLQLANPNTEYVGLPEDATNIGREQGSFRVLKETRNNDGEKEVTVQFTNDGLHPIFGESLPSANGKTEFKPVSKIKERSFNIIQYDENKEFLSSTSMEGLEYSEDENGHTTVKANMALDEKTEFISFTVETSSSDYVVSPWFYHLDKVAPTGTVEYSTKDSIYGEVLVTLTTSEPVEAIEGWVKNSDTEFVKSYDKNIKENVSFVDLKGNKGTSTIEITNIKVNENAPVIHAKDQTIPLNSQFDPMKDVTATDIEDGDLTDRIKVVLNDVNTKKAGQYKVGYQVTDLAKKTTTKYITVTVVDKNAHSNPTNKKPGVTNGTNTGVFTSIGLFTGMATAALSGVGILEILKKRKK